MVATLSSFITEATLRPVCLKSGWFSSIRISVVFGFFDFDEINAATTSFSLSYKIKAGRSFVAVKSVNGKEIRTILPFNLGCP